VASARFIYSAVLEAAQLPIRVAQTQRFNGGQALKERRADSGGPAGDLIESRPGDDIEVCIAQSYGVGGTLRTGQESYLPEEIAGAENSQVVMAVRGFKRQDHAHAPAAYEKQFVPLPLAAEDRLACRSPALDKSRAQSRQGGGIYLAQKIYPGKIEQFPGIRTL
jgi:hypothetical protein